MSDEERTELAVQIMRIGTALEGLVRQYANDEERKETQRIEDREEKRIFRDEILERQDRLEKKIAPVVFHHEIIVTGGKWVVASVAGVFGMVKGWIYLKDTLGK